METKDQIRPAHYNGMQCLALISECTVYEHPQCDIQDSGYKGFLTGNIIKYVYRYKNKNGLDDLKKAWTYAMWLLEAFDIAYYDGLYENLFEDRVIASFDTIPEKKAAIKSLLLSALHQPEKDVIAAAYMLEKLIGIETKESEQ